MRLPIRYHRFAALAFVASLPLPAVLVAADGSPDTTFDTDGQQIIGWGAGTDPATAYAVAAYAGGSLLVGGDVDATGLGTDFGVVKLTAAGAVDISWAGLGRIRVPVDAFPNSNDSLRDIAILPSGSVLLAGLSNLDDALGPPDRLPAVVKLTPAGALESSFGTGGVVVVPLPWPTSDYGFINPIHQADGKTLFAGYCYNCPDNTLPRPMLLRLTVGGVPDVSFSGDGWWVDPTGILSITYPNAIAVDGAGRILVLADAGSEIVFRLTASGVLDTSFGGGDGYVYWPRPTGVSAPYTFAVDGSSGAMYVGSYCVAGANQFASLVTRLDASGAVDPTFGGDGQVEIALPDAVWFNALRLQSDGKVLLAGKLQNGDNDPVLVRLLPNGALDTSFSGDGVRHVSFGQSPDGNEQAYAITLSGGRVVEVGNVIVSGVSRFGITRWTSDLLFTDGFERGTAGGWGAH